MNFSLDDFFNGSLKNIFLKTCAILGFVAVYSVALLVLAIHSFGNGIIVLSESAAIVFCSFTVAGALLFIFGLLACEESMSRRAETKPKGNCAQAHELSKRESRNKSFM